MIAPIAVAFAVIALVFLAAAFVSVFGALRSAYVLGAHSCLAHFSRPIQVRPDRTLNADCFNEAQLQSASRNWYLRHG